MGCTLPPARPISSLSAAKSADSKDELCRFAQRDATTFVASSRRVGSAPSKRAACVRSSSFSFIASDWLAMKPIRVPGAVLGFIARPVRGGAAGATGLGAVSDVVSGLTGGIWTRPAFANKLRAIT